MAKPKVNKKPATKQKSSGARKNPKSQPLEPEVLAAEADDFLGEKTIVPSSTQSSIRQTNAQEPEFWDSSTETAVAPSDPLRRYLEELRRYPVMSPEQQNELAVKFKNTGDLKFARALVTTNLRLVVKIAMEYRTTYSNVLDLIQEGNVGLMKAVSNFDPYKGTRLSYYASWWIRSYILKFLLDNFRLVKVGTTQAQKKLFYNLIREKERLEAQGIQAGPKLLADRLDVREKDVVDMNLRLSSQGGEVSLDKPMGGSDDGRGASIGDSLVDEGELADARMMHDQLQTILHAQIDSFLAKLGEKERIVFQERLMSEEPKTLQEIADKFGITRERSRQIEAKVIDKLREHMRSHMDGLPKVNK